jgi:nucleotide-binding universal stress UspA family protein
MTERIPPTRLTVATDMSARCDRALARAWQLTRTWNRDLDVVHAVSAAEVTHRDRLSGEMPSWRRLEPWTSTLERHLRTDLAAEGICASSLVVVGSPAEVVMGALANSAPSLIVLGIAKDARMDRIQLGSTVDNLVRHSRVPVLNVRSRARAPYRHVVVATDFSGPAGQALALAARWFEGARLTLFHAYLPPGATLATGAAADGSWRAAVAQQCESHLAGLDLPASTVPTLQRLLEHGHAEELLADYVAHADVDLVVLGSQGRGGFARVLLGSTAEHLLPSARLSNTS